VKLREFVGVLEDDEVDVRVGVEVILVFIVGVGEEVLVLLGVRVLVAEREEVDFGVTEAVGVEEYDEDGLVSPGPEPPATPAPVKKTPCNIT